MFWKSWQILGQFDHKYLYRNLLPKGATGYNSTFLKMVSIISQKVAGIKYIDMTTKMNKYVTYAALSMPV